jgi:hypothetical protein
MRRTRRMGGSREEKPRFDCEQTTSAQKVTPCIALGSCSFPAPIF